MADFIIFLIVHPTHYTWVEGPQWYCMYVWMQVYNYDKRIKNKFRLHILFPVHVDDLYSLLQDLYVEAAPFVEMSRLVPCETGLCFSGNEYLTNTRSSFRDTLLQIIWLNLILLGSFVISISYLAFRTPLLHFIPSIPHQRSGYPTFTMYVHLLFRMLSYILVYSHNEITLNGYIAGPWIVWVL